MALWGGVALLGIGAWLVQPSCVSSNTRFNLRSGVFTGACGLFRLWRYAVLGCAMISGSPRITRTPNENGPEGNNICLRCNVARRGDIVDRKQRATFGEQCHRANGLSSQMYPVADQFTIQAFANIWAFSSSCFGLVG